MYEPRTQETSWQAEAERQRSRKLLDRAIRGTVGVVLAGGLALTGHPDEGAVLGVLGATVLPTIADRSIRAGLYVAESIAKTATNTTDMVSSSIRRGVRDSLTGVRNIAVDAGNSVIGGVTNVVEKGARAVVQAGETAAQNTKNTVDATLHNLTDPVIEARKRAVGELKEALVNLISSSADKGQIPFSLNSPLETTPQFTVENQPPTAEEQMAEMINEMIKLGYDQTEIDAAVLERRKANGEIIVANSHILFKSFSKSAISENRTGIPF